MQPLALSAVSQLASRLALSGVRPLVQQVVAVAVVAVVGLGLAALVDPVALEDVVLSNLKDEIQPEEVDGLQGGEQAEADELADPALVVLALPVDAVGADGAEAGEVGVQDPPVDVVAEVDPDEGEEGEVGADDGRVEVVEAFGGLGGSLLD